MARPLHGSQLYRAHSRERPRPRPYYPQYTVAPKTLNFKTCVGAVSGAMLIRRPRAFRDLTRQGITVVMVTHNLDLARSADRRLEIRDGKIHGG